MYATVATLEDLKNVSSAFLNNDIRRTKRPLLMTWSNRASVCLYICIAPLKIWFVTVLSLLIYTIAMIKGIVFYSLLLLLLLLLLLFIIISIINIINIINIIMIIIIIVIGITIKIISLYLCLLSFNT